VTATRTLPLALFSLLLAGCCPAIHISSPGVAAPANDAAIAGASDHPNSVMLDKEPLKVFWNDGDSFRVNSRAHKGEKTRLVGFNALESHGPVHRWGTWKANDLAWMSKRATKLARSQRWICHRVRSPDGSAASGGYGRTLVSCPELARTLVSEGLAHALIFDPGDAPALMEAQLKAQQELKGMWKHGVPKSIVTSVHSADEARHEKDWRPYNRVASTLTGLTRKVEHDNTYAECEEICIEGSCFIYVPWDRRYGDDRAPCLRYR
jgi:micrococcal nuclease